MLTIQFWAECFHQAALVPLVVAVVLAMRGSQRDAGWWWMLAGIVGMSWCADTAADILPKSWSWVPSMVYPAPQAALVARVFFRRSEALAFLALLTAFASFVVLAHGVNGPEYLFRAFAWFGILGAAWIAGQRGRLLVALAIYFGVGWLAWLAFSLNPTARLWYVYQVVQLIGLLVLSWAMWTARVPLRLVK